MKRKEIRRERRRDLLLEVPVRRRVPGERRFRENHEIRRRCAVEVSVYRVEDAFGLTPRSRELEHTNADHGSTLTRSLDSGPGAR